MFVLTAAPDSLTLPDPELQDKMSYDDDIVIKYTEAGDLYSTVNSRALVREYQFVLNKAEYDDAVTFLEVLRDRAVTVSGFVSFTGRIEYSSRKLSGLRRAADCNGDDVFELTLVFYA
jgi:hypothetical protein